MHDQTIKDGSQVFILSTRGIYSSYREFADNMRYSDAVLDDQNKTCKELGIRAGAKCKVLTVGRHLTTGRKLCIVEMVESKARFIIDCKFLENINPLTDGRRDYLKHL